MRAPLRIPLSYRSQDRWLRLAAPISVLLQLAVFVFLVIVGVSMIIYGQFDLTWKQAAWQAAATVTTLGTTEAVNWSSAMSAAVGAFLGLVIIAVFMGYLVGLYSAYVARESFMARFAQVGGEPAWGPMVLARSRMIFGDPAAACDFDEWTDWITDLRIGQPGSSDEANLGDAAAAVLVGDDSGGAVIAEYLGGASVTEEFIERWRTPGSSASGTWEERFGETQYLPLGLEAWKRGLDDAGVPAESVDRLIVTGLHTRAVKALVPRLGAPKEALTDDRSAVLGVTGAAQAGLVLTDVLEQAGPGQTIALLSLADGADLLVFRTTDAIAAWNPTRTVARQVEWGAPIGYGKFLAWRNTLAVEGPRRPAPNRISASVSARNREYKYAFVGSRDASTGALHLPPQRISRDGDAQDDMVEAPMSEVEGTIATFTIDRIAYSPSPPIVFAVVDFDGGGRLPVELCDLDADALQIGDRVELTFRRLFTAEGIHNYFWKARPVRS